jgi:hypothetical protein
MRGDQDDEPPRQARYGLFAPPHVHRSRDDALAYLRLIARADGSPRRLIRAPRGEWWVVVEEDAARLVEDADGFFLDDE